MKQPLLIDKSTVEEYLQVSLGYSPEVFERFLREAQEFDLKPLLCEEFYYELLKDSTVEPFNGILPGLEYDHEGKTYYHEGLEAVLSYFTYARFILKGDVISTTHGIVVKRNPNSSEPLSSGQKKDIYHTSRQDAYKLFESVAKYMDRKKINYKDCSDCGETTNQDIITRAPQW